MKSGIVVIIQNEFNSTKKNIYMMLIMGYKMFDKNINFTQLDNLF